MDSVKISRNNKGQSIQLPEKYEFQGNRVYIRQIGNILLLIPEDQPWQTMIETLGLFTDDFMTERGQPPHQQRENLFD